MRLTVLAIAALGLVASRADAYPQFQLSSGADTCKQCHFSPAGGGLLNEYGRDEAGSTLSWKEGDGGFLHGAWTPPASFQIGGDLRGVAGYRVDDDPESLIFPMQMELYLRPSIGPVSLYVNAGIRPNATEGPFPGSREHYLMYEDEGGAWYARAGRFYPIYGLRAQDHTSYVRRRLDMYLYDEPYGVGFGRYGASSELHVSAFARSPSPELGTSNDFGAAVYWERRGEDATSAYAAQARASFSDLDRRAWVGGIYKRWMEGAQVLVLAEGDLGVQAFDDAPEADPRLQALGSLGVTWFATQGLLVGGVIQAYDEDLRLRASGRHAFDVNVQWFPMPHLELHLLTRVEAVGSDVGDPVLLVLPQLHYYL